MTLDPNGLHGGPFDPGTHRFAYRAVDRYGKVVAGFIAASSRQSALDAVEKMSLMPIEVGADIPAGTILPAAGRNPPAEDITAATRDLATLLRSGITLDRALLVIADTGDMPAVAALMRALNAAVMAGRSLSDALSTYPKAFPTHYVKMVEVAEAKGKLADTLTLIAHERARSETLKRRITSALAYPAFLFVAATGVLIFVLTSVVPEFERALADFRREAGSQTEVIFALSRALRDNGPLLAALVIAGLVGLLLANRSLPVRSAVFQVLARMPGVRKAVLYEQTTAMCATLSALLASGVDISSALRLVRDLMRDRSAAARLDLAIRKVRQGEGVSDVLREGEVLPPYAAHMLQIGERAGDMSAALARISATYEEKLDRSLARLTAIVGPVVLILVSAMVAWIIVSVMTALLSMNDLLLTEEYSHAFARLA